MTTDRDRSIEGLLRRAQPADRAPHGDCPDAETLAALADGTLSAAARRDIDAHMADCNRCQMVAAAMVRADALSGRLKPAPTTDEVAGGVPAWRRRAFNWLVPAAAAATAVALWVLVPGQRTPLPEAPREEQKTAALSVPSPSPEPPPTSERLVEEPLRLPSDSPADGATPERETGTRQSAAAESAAPSDMAQTGNAAALQGRAAGQANPAAAPQEERLAAAAASAPSIPRSSSVEAAAPPPAVAAAPPPAPPPPAAPPAAPPAGALAPAPSQVEGRREEAVASFEVVSSNPQIRWRIGPGSLVQYSANGGATWMIQQTGVTGTFTAGSAPAAGVLWLVGPAGLVMRTADAGRQWERSVFPEAGELKAITASTALEATVDLADARRFRTTDGGRTWVAFSQ